MNAALSSVLGNAGSWYTKATTSKATKRKANALEDAIIIDVGDADGNATIEPALSTQNSLGVSLPSVTDYKSGGKKQKAASTEEYDGSDEDDEEEEEDNDFNEEYENLFNTL